MIHKIMVSTVLENKRKKVVSVKNITQLMLDCAKNKETAAGEFFNIFFNKEHMVAVEKEDVA